nr:helix-turn-helix domain-containing protein [Frankia sp. AgW1.1]
MATGPETRLRADARRNRDRIIATAKLAFADDGPDVPMEEIARLAGVGVGTLYRRFPDRDALVVAVVRDSLATALAPAPAPPPRAHEPPPGGARPRPPHPPPPRPPGGAPAPATAPRPRWPAPAPRPPRPRSRPAATTGPAPTSPPGPGLPRAAPPAAGQQTRRVPDEPGRRSCTA